MVSSYLRWRDLSAFDVRHKFCHSDQVVLWVLQSGKLELGTGPILLHPIHAPAWHDGDYLRHSRRMPRGVCGELVAYGSRELVA